MDLALNNLQMLICHKTQQTNQTTFLIIVQCQAGRKNASNHVISELSFSSLDNLPKNSVQHFHENFLVAVH